MLDEAYVARGGYVLVSEDMYYRQAATAAVGGEVKKFWLQPIFAFARKASLIDAKRQAEITVRAGLAAAWSPLSRCRNVVERAAEDTSAELVDYRRRAPSLALAMPISCRISRFLSRSCCAFGRTVASQS